MLTSAVSKVNDDENDHPISSIELKINISYKDLIPDIKLLKLDLVTISDPLSNSPIILKTPSDLNKAIGERNRIIWKLCHELTVLVFQHSDTKTLCALMLVCRLFLEAANSKEICFKLGIDKLNTNFYQPTFFAPQLLEQNSLEKIKQDYKNNPCFNFIDPADIMNSNRLSELIVQEDARPEQPGDGTNGFVLR